MKKTVLLICSIFTVSTLCSAASNQTMEDETVDTAELVKKIGALGLSYGKKSWNFIKPKSVKDGLIKAFIANNLIRATPAAYEYAKKIQKKQIVSHLLSLPASMCITGFLAPYVAEYSGQDVTSPLAKEAIYNSAWGATLRYVQTLFMDLDPNSQRSGKVNEQLEVAKKELQALEEIKSPLKGDPTDEFEVLKELCHPDEEGIRNFIDRLIKFDPNNKNSKTPVSYWHGQPSSAKTERMKEIGEAARKLGYEVHMLCNVSAAENQTYVGVGEKLLTDYAQILKEKRESGAKILVLFDEAIAKSQNTTNTNGTGNDSPAFTTLIDTLALAKIPLICATNTSSDEIREAVRVRFSSSKTYLEGDIVEAKYPDATRAQMAAELLFKKSKLPYEKQDETTRLIGCSLNTCNFGILYNVLTKITKKHEDEKLIIDATKAESKEIIISGLASELERAKTEKISSYEELLNNVNIPENRKKKRLTRLTEQIQEYNTNYQAIAKKHSPILVKDAFLTGGELSTVIAKIHAIDQAINPPKENEKIEKKEKEKEEVVENKTENKEIEKKNEKIEKKETNEKIEVIENEKIEKKKVENKPDIKTLADELQTTLTKKDPNALIKLFEENTNDETGENAHYDPDYMKEAENLVRFHELMDEKHKFQRPEYRTAMIIKVARKLKNEKVDNKTAQEIAELRTNFKYELKKTLSQGASFLYNTASATAAVGKRVSDYAYIGNWLSGIANAWDSLPSPFSSKEDSQKLDIVRYKSILSIYATYAKIPHQQSLVNLLGSMIQNSGSQQEAMFAQTCGALMKIEKPKENDGAYMIDDSYGHVCVKKDSITAKAFASAITSKCDVTFNDKKDQYVNLYALADNLKMQKPQKQ